jgi:hypothetical protein
MNKRIYLIIFIVGILYMIIDDYFIAKHSRQFYLNMQFNGIVQSINYETKGFPEISVNGRKYYFANEYNFRDQIEQGDSIFKYSGRLECTLIKKKTGRALIFQSVIDH